MIRATCPDVCKLQALLDGGGHENEPDELVRHLETCLNCQQTLQTLAGEPDDWSDTALGLVDAAREEPALRHAVEQLKSEEPTVEEREPLSFLQPTDKPGLLGTLGQYEVLEEIGRGGMGVVLKALDPALNRVVAIKVLSPWLASSATARRRFVRESRAAAAVCHDHLVTVHGVDEANGLPYLVMQYIPGESLQARLDRSGPLELGELVRIGLQTASGLAAAHAQGLIHRDIKPANLLLENGLARVKITDFGLARMTDDVQLTQHGVVAGTPEYMAPEQARGEPVDHRADLFSLGSVLYAMCTGVPPFRGATAVAVLRKVSDQAPMPIRSRNPEVPAWLEALVARLLAKNPSDRFQSAAEVAVLLEGYLAHLRQPAIVIAPELPCSPLTLPTWRQADKETRRQGDKETGNRQLSSLLVSLSPCLLVCLLLVAVGTAVGVWLFAGSGRTYEMQEHVTFDFREGVENYPSLVLYGPDAAIVTTTESEGLRIALPATRPDTNVVGVELLSRIRGDFDIVLGYELLDVGKPPPEFGAGVHLRVAFDSSTPFDATMTRLRKPAGDILGAHRINEGADGKEQWSGRDVPAKERYGKLRLVRVGSQLQYFVADGEGEYQQIRSEQIGTADITSVRVFCSSGWQPVAVDVRLSDLTLDADRFVDGLPTGTKTPLRR